MSVGVASLTRASRRNLNVVAAGLVILVVAALPQLYRNEFTLRVIAMIMLWSILAIGQNVITGFCGQLSLGHAAFYGIGAYTSALLTMRLGAPFPVALVVAGLAAGVAGVAIGGPAVRIAGDYLFIVTLGFGEIVRQIFLNWDDLTNGPLGIPAVPRASILSYTLESNSDYYYLFGALLLVVSWSARRIVHSDIGRSFKAIREDETAALASGINVTFYKVLAFGIGAFYAGLAGSGVAHFLTFVGPDNFTQLESTLVFEIVILGGLGSIPGSILGTALVVGATESFRWLVDYRLYLGGGLLLAMMLARPQGLIGTVRLRAPRAPAIRAADEREVSRSFSSRHMVD